jgi:hypothetical protein
MCKECIRLRAHGGCDRSAEDAYSFATPDLVFPEVRVSLIFTVDYFIYLIWALILTADFSVYLA